MKSEQQLRSTSDEVLRALEKLRELELEKRSVSPTSPRFQELARQVEQLADRLAGTAEVQADLGEKIADEHAATGERAAPIEATERDVITILNEWRDAERRIYSAAAGSADETAARAEAEGLRAEYQRALRAASERNSRT